MVARKEFRQMAKTFMEVIHSETGYDVVIYDRAGRIVQATDGSRVGHIHAGAAEMIQKEESEISITAEQARDNAMVREGYSRRIVIDGKILGGFGITGPLTVTRPLGRISAKILESWIDEFILYTELENRVKERTLILNQEIEAKKAVEKVLRENQARFEAFTRAIPDILFVFDEDGRYVEIFTASDDLLVIDPEDLKGKLIQDVLPQDAARIHHESIRKVAKTGKGQFFEYKLKVPKGLRWFESRTALIRGIDDGKRLIASSVRDITRRKRAETEVREKAKLDVVIETAGGVCHEFNQPLQIIAGACDLLTTYPDLDPEITRIIAKISDQVERMGKLNKNLMNITAYKTKAYMESKIIDIQKSIKE
ncbi:MAG: PAS domain-containing protein [Desulfobacter sp.]|nr:MAG: PAS domain-containing protein [Desulfobacter sp.]